MGRHSISLSELQAEAEEGCSQWKVGDEFVFVNGSAMWNQLNGLTGVVEKINPDDPFYTFLVRIDREDLIPHVDGFIDDEGFLRVACSAGNLCREADIPEEQKRHINRGQGKVRPRLDVDALYPESAVTHPKLTLDDLPGLFAPEDLSGADTWEPDPNQSGSNRDWLQIRYETEMSQEPENILFVLRYLLLMHTKGASPRLTQVMRRVEAFPKTLDTFQKLHLPVATILLDSGDLEEAAQLLDQIPETDRTRLGGFRDLIRVVWVLQRKIAGQAAWQTPLLKADRFRASRFSRLRREEENTPK